MNNVISRISEWIVGQFRLLTSAIIHHNLFPLQPESFEQNMNFMAFTR